MTQLKIKETIERKKPFVVINPPNSALWKIVVDGGGHVPQALLGSWTNRPLAQKALDTYNGSFAAGAFSIAD